MTSLQTSKCMCSTYDILWLVGPNVRQRDIFHYENIYFLQYSIIHSHHLTHISLKLETFYYKNMHKIEFFGSFGILDSLYNSKFNEICVIYSK